MGRGETGPTHPPTHWPTCPTMGGGGSHKAPTHPPNPGLLGVPKVGRNQYGYITPAFSGSTRLVMARESVNAKSNCKFWEKFHTVLSKMHDVPPTAL